MLTQWQDILDPTKQQDELAKPNVCRNCRGKGSFAAPQGMIGARRQECFDCGGTGTAGGLTALVKLPGGLAKLFSGRKASKPEAKAKRKT